MIVLMAGGAALSLLMREDRLASQHLAAAQMHQGGGESHGAQTQAEPQRRLYAPGLGGQHVHRHLPREEDPLFR